MIKTEIFCDHCGKKLDPMSDYTDVTIEAAHKWINADLCTDCLEKLYLKIGEFVKAKEGARDGDIY